MSEYLKPKQKDTLKFNKKKKKEKRKKLSIKIIIIIAIVCAVIFIGYLIIGKVYNNQTSNRPRKVLTKISTSENNYTTETTEKTLDIDPLKESSYKVNQQDVTSINGEKLSDEEERQYEFTSVNAGTYRIEFSNIPQDVSFDLELYNSNMEQLDSEGSCGNEEGITYDLDANTKYNVIVKQSYGNGSYTLNFGSQSDTVEVSLKDNPMYQEFENCCNLQLCRK